jgi:hypothetical protein
MPARNLFYFYAVSFATLLTAMAAGQETLKLRPPEAAPPAASPEPAQEKTMALTVPKGAPLEIALDKDIRVRKAGQEIHGRVVQPVYAFDELVVPAGTDVGGHIAKIERISGKNRVFGILNGDLTPARKVDVEFTDLLFPDGKRVPFQAVITPGTGRPIQLVTAKDDGKKKGIQDAAAKKIDEAKQQARETWNQAMKQVKAPGKMRRLEQYAIAQLPARHQYLHPGTVYFAELEQPLDFGSEVVTASRIASLGTPPPTGSLVHALLITPLDSATTQKGAEVEAVLSQPLLDGDRLILCEGSRLKGTVVQAKPARRWHHNGQLRIIFRELVPPDGVQQKVVASLESVQAGRDEHVKLDSEGGAEATSPKTRYVSTALTLALTTAAFRQHNDADDAAEGQSNNGVAGGIAGFKLVGLVLGVAVKSQPVGMAMGAYGSARSVYSHFIAKGRDVTFAKNTPMEISLGAPRKPPLTTTQPDGSAADQKQ